MEREVIDEQVIKKHGFWLSAYLILMFVVNPLIAFVYFNNPEMINQAFPQMTTGILYFMAVMAIVNVALAAGIKALPINNLYVSRLI